MTSKTSTIARIRDHDVEPEMETQDAQDAANKAKRKQMFIRLGVGIAAVALAYGAYDVLFASNHVETDNAYVGADVAQITTQVTAPVREVLVSDTQAVKKGDVLVRLDDTDARIALAKAEANLALTERRVKGLSATDLGLGGQSLAALHIHAGLFQIGAGSGTDRGAQRSGHRDCQSARRRGRRGAGRGQPRGRQWHA